VLGAPSTIERWTRLAKPLSPIDSRTNQDWATSDG
jgi:hypothetical protein